MTARESTTKRTRRAPLSARAAAIGHPNIRLLAALVLALLALTLLLAPRAEAFVYWDWANPNAGRIGRANLDGSGVKQDFVLLPRGAGRRLAVGDTHLYWTNHDASEPVGNIGRANLDGTGTNQSFIADVQMSFFSGVAVDEEHVYWVSRFDDDPVESSPGTGAIGRAKLDGTGVDESFITGLSFPSGAVAVDDSHLYWSIDFPSGFLYDVPDRIGRANLDGTGVEEGFIDASGVVAVTVDDSHVWWASSSRSGGGIERAALDGTDVESVIGGENFFPDAVAVDDTHVYWRGGFSSPASIGRAKLDGSRANHEFMTGIGEGGSVAVDGLGPRPSNEFSFGRAKKNNRKGTAKLTVKVPGPGELDLAKTKKVKADEDLAEAEGKEKLAIKPKGKAKKKLNSKGKTKVTAEVTFTPDGGEPNTDTKTVKLVKR